MKAAAVSFVLIMSVFCGAVGLCLYADPVNRDETRVYECPGMPAFTGVWDWRHERLIDGDQFVIYPPSGCKITIIESDK